MKPLTIATLAILFFAGCATPPAKIANTASGRPEVIIADTQVGRVKSLLIGELVNDGYSIEQDTDYSLTMSRDLKGGEQIGAAMLVGNSYSSNSRLTSFNFVQGGQNLRVIASGTIRAVMPGGKTNTLSLDNNNAVFNILQELLNEIKERIDSKPIQ